MNHSVAQNRLSLNLQLGKSKRIAGQDGLSPMAEESRQWLPAASRDPPRLIRRPLPAARGPLVLDLGGGQGGWLRRAPPARHTKVACTCHSNAKAPCCAWWPKGGICHDSWAWVVSANGWTSVEEVATLEDEHVSRRASKNHLFVVGGQVFVHQCAEMVMTAC